MGLFSNLTPDQIQSFMGLAGAAQGFGQAAMPTRVPTPLGPVLASGIGGIAQGLGAAQNYQKQNIENQTGQLNLNMMKALMPAQIASIQNAMTQQTNGVQTVPGMSHPQAIMMAESGGNPNAIGDGGAATGLMQLHADAAKDAGYTPEQIKDPVLNLAAGQKYLQQQYARFADKSNPALWATVAYNMGPTATQKWDGNVSSLPQTTQQYVGKVDGLMKGGLLGAGAQASNIINGQGQIDPDKAQYDSLLNKANAFALPKPETAKIFKDEAEQTPYFQRLKANISGTQEQQNKAADQGFAVQKSINDDGDLALKNYRNIQQLQQLSQNMTPNKLAGIQKAVSEYRLAIDPDGSKGISSPQDRTFAAATEGIDKITAQMAGNAIREWNSRGGNRVEFENYLKNMPNSEMSQGGFQNMTDFMAKSEMLLIQKQQEFSQWKQSKKPYEYPDFDSYWNQKQMSNMNKTLSPIPRIQTTSTNRPPLSSFMGQ